MQSHAPLSTPFCVQRDLLMFMRCNQSHKKLQNGMRYLLLCDILTKVMMEVQPTASVGTPS
ncbi:Uncharacterized protein APZ42_023209 [Daphnia magna]|uniref:Uncharacterized protein n=1 Tax=Daphnia magna TaxID=35525 RepID=A0A164V4R4_9CRUS|nr:Uncharacterized protein APZ42_023209 [Daphnia magna]